MVCLMTCRSPLHRQAAHLVSCAEHAGMQFHTESPCLHVFAHGRCWLSMGQMLTGMRTQLSGLVWACCSACLCLSVVSRFSVHVQVAELLRNHGELALGYITQV